MHAASRSVFDDLQHLRILVVDDDADARDLLDAILTDCGATVSLAGSAAEAMVFAEKGEIDLVVSDIGMPEEDGYSLIGRIRKLPAPMGQVPAVAVTAYATRADRQKALAAGFNEHLPKPLDLAALARFMSTV